MPLAKLGLIYLLTTGELLIWRYFCLCIVFIYIFQWVYIYNKYSFTILGIFITMLHFLLNFKQFGLFIGIIIENTWLRFEGV